MTVSSTGEPGVKARNKPSWRVVTNEKKSRKIVKRTQGWNMVGKVRLHGSQVAQETHRKDAGFSPRVPFPKKIEESKATSNMPREGCRDPGRR